MKKFFKYFLIFSIIFILGFLILFKGKIILYVNIAKKYYQLKDNTVPASTTLNTEPMKDIDFKDVIYKNTNGTPLTLDIYQSKKKLQKGSPVILYVHGGSWVYGDKSIPSTISPLLNTLREEGYTIISTSYELLRKDMNFKKQVSDVKDTLRWINKNKDIYGFNTDEIGLLGLSSGAQLSLLAAYTGDDEFKDDPKLSNYSSKVKYVIDFFGPTDLNTLDMSETTFDIDKIIKTTKNKDEILTKYSPINFVKGSLPKTLIIHSLADKIVPYKNATALYEKCKDNGTDVKLITLNNSGHDFSGITENDIVTLAKGLLQFIVWNSPF
jgi:triacylglycerol lipase